jgi:hypothetical protein
MVMSQTDALEQAKRMIEWRDAERSRLDLIRSYIRDEQRLTWLPTGTPNEVIRLARLARVNVLSFIVDSSAQSLYVDGLRSKESGDSPVWDLWRANRMNARQIGVHRSALSYGAAYASVLPGDPVPVIRGVSPRRMTVVYGQDDDWPMWALERRRTEKGELWRLYDDNATYWIGEDGEGGPLEFISYEEHGVGEVPIVRYRESDNLDDEVVGIVEPLMRLQDQINVTTFSLLVAQHYGAHRQRYIIGWLAESEEQALKASAQKLWTFDDSPDDVKIGEFEQTQLDGYIASREATLRHLATISQTPVHELLGSLANLSAEALVAARDSHNRKLEEHRTVLGESHEQTLTLAANQAGMTVDPSSWVRWRDMEGRALSQIADALGKFAEMLGIPKRALWERAADAIGAQQDEVETWASMAAEDDSIRQLTDLLNRQMDG